MSAVAAGEGSDGANTAGANASSATGSEPRGVTVDRRPARVAASVAVVAALLSVVAVADGGSQRVAIGVGAAGLLLLGGTALARDRGLRLVAVLVGVAGVVGVLGGVGAGATLPATTTLKAEVPLGLLGAGLLALGLVPVREGWSRRLVSVGTALLVCNVVLSGIVHGADALPLLAAFTASVVAWDVGEHAINVGEQLGARARTWPVELGHAGATSLFGGAAVAVALWVRGLDVTGVPLAGLLLLVGAAIVLLVALYN
ncbi:hypothetical protein ACFO0N_08275 [Halobium salinum]|uniref:DUF1275 domain-containing protein n=1 Tax=Halobium salinum TaxID=1364940 RepID=A0ABD5PAM6_9EURY|nr:hypothetical protein [Halobium salinum]